jgi:REP element-mobilizing transposase RayT
MGQSLIRNYVHIIFSTKNRLRYIKEDRKEIIFSYIGALCNKKKCQVLRVGGYEDHIHILCLLDKNITLVDLIRFIKTNSSRWIKGKFPEINSFAWQEGYGSFSINPQQIELVIEYIDKQKIHHGKVTFEGEYLAFLKKYNIDYDERFIWK